MSADVIDVARNTIRRHAMLASGETVLVGVSGGADSIALLHVLASLAAEWSLTLHVLHVDHRLRPDSARDAEFVRTQCRQLGVPVEVAVVDVRARSSIEEAARRARYAALEAQAARVGAHRIAVGHTANDQAETVLMRVLQGAGVRGLAGIPFVRGRIIRPLLLLRRVQIVGYLEGAGLPWQEDPTNQDLKFLRNRIRHEVLPWLAAMNAGDPVAALNGVARHARESVEALDALAATSLARLAIEGENALMLSRAELAALPRPVAVAVVHLAALRFGGRALLRAWAHRGLARVVASAPPPRPFTLGGATIEVSGDRVRVAPAPAPALRPRSLGVPSRLALSEVGLEITARMVPGEGYVAPRHPHLVAFDAARLASPLMVRARRPGDRFHPFGAPGEQRLKRLFIDAKVPRWERARIPLVEAGGEIIWVAGLRRGVQAPVGAESRRVLELALTPLAK